MFLKTTFQIRQDTNAGLMGQWMSRERVWMEIYITLTNRENFFALWRLISQVLWSRIAPKSVKIAAKIDLCYIWLWTGKQRHMLPSLWWHKSWERRGEILCRNKRYGAMARYVLQCYCILFVFCLV